MSLPPGSWISTCRNYSVNGDTLTAQCEDIHGKYQPTSVQISPCNNGFSNINGVLKCNVNPLAQSMPTPGTCGYGPEGHCACTACRCCLASDYIKQAGFKIITDEQTAATYAIRFGSPSDVDSIFYPKTIIMSHRIAWWQKQPGDCGTKQSISTPLLPQLSKDIGLGGSAIGAATSVAAMGGLTGVAGALALGGPITAIASAVLLPLSFIEAHHAQAVAKETSMGCAASSAWNQFADAMESALIAGRIGVLDAVQYLNAAVQQIKPMIDSIAIKPGDAAYMMRYGLLGLQQLYLDSEIARLAAMAPSAKSSLPTSQPAASTMPSITTGLSKNPVALGIAAALVIGLIAAAFVME